MIWYGYLCQIAAGLMALWMLKVTYFFIKRRYIKSSVVDKNSAEESDIYTSSENVYNESSSESLNVEHEQPKKSNRQELLCRLDKKDELSEVLRTNNLELKKIVDTDLDSKIYCDLVHLDSTLIKKNIMDINNVTVCSGYSSTEEEMQESNNYITSQDVLDTSKLNSDSHSSIISWESCNKEISHAESDVVNSLSSGNHTEICQPLNLCMRDIKNKTGTNKITKTYFTDRKYKTTNGIQKVNSGKYLITETIEDYDQCSLDFEKMKNLNSFDNKEQSVNNDKLEYKKYLEITKLSSIRHDDEYSLDDTQHELKDENNLEITKLSSIRHDDEYSLDDTDYQEVKAENNLEMTKLSSIQHAKYSLDDTERELKYENNLEITKLSSIRHDDEYSLDDTDYQELKTENSLEITELSSIHHDEYSLDDTDQEVKAENNLEMTKLSSIQHAEYSLDDTETENNLEMSELSSLDIDEYSLDDTEHKLKVENNVEITELSSIHHEELEDNYSLDNTKHSLNNDDLMLVNHLETTEISPIYQAEQHYEYNLESPERSFFNNDISISGICSPNIKCNYDYEVQDNKGFNNTSSSECTESFPSPIYNNDSSIDDIRYVEDYRDISFFDPTLSDDAMNEAFVED